MLFNSFPFLALFGAFLVVYYATAAPYRWWLLLAASLGLYATQGSLFVPLLVGTSAIAYVGALAIERRDGAARRLATTTAVVAVVAILVFFKYYDFLADGVSTLLTTVGVRMPRPKRLGLPAVAGLSFYVFSCVSYLVDVSRGTLPAERHPGQFLLYVSFFPKLLAGPIERAGTFLAQVRRPRPLVPEQLWSGLHTFAWGLFKKVVIADGLATFVDAAYGRPALAAPSDLLIGTYFEALQIYGDFSGYSDMAIGLARMLGIDLLENFRRPYFSRSVPEFWSNRWHLSLAYWFRDYLYFPLGGSRTAWPRHALNVMAVFAVSGLWHGASWTFVAWGLLNGLYVASTVVVQRLRPSWHAAWDRLPVPLQVFATFHLVLLTWVFFRATSLADAWTVMTRIAGAGASLPLQVWQRLGTDHVVMLVLCAGMFAVEWFEEREPVRLRLLRAPVSLRWAYYYAIVGLLLVCGSWQVRQFVYMQF